MENITSIFRKHQTVKKFASNTGWMIARSVYSMLLSLVLGSLSARFLGPSNYGLLGYSASLISFFTIITKLGLDSFIVAEMVRTPQKCGSYLGSAILLRLALSLLSIILMYLVLKINNSESSLLLKVTLYQSFALLFQSAEVLYYWFQKNWK